MREATLYTLNTKKVIVGSESSIRTYITRSGTHIGSNMVNLDEDNVMVDLKPQEITLPLYRITRVLKPDDPLINPLPYDDLRIKEFYFAIEPALADILEQPYIDENFRLERELCDLDGRYKKSVAENSRLENELYDLDKKYKKSVEEVESLQRKYQEYNSQTVRQKLGSLLRQIFNK